MRGIATGLLSAELGVMHCVRDMASFAAIHLSVHIVQMDDLHHHKAAGNTG